MSEEQNQDAYMGEEDFNSAQDVDLSFLDEDKENNK